MAELVGDGESLALAPVLGVHDDQGDRRQARAPGSRDETADAPERHGEYLDTSFFEEFDEVGYGLVAETPMVAESVGGAVGFDGIAVYGIRRVPRLVPMGAG